MQLFQQKYDTPTGNITGGTRKLQLGAANATSACKRPSTVCGGKKRQISGELTADLNVYKTVFNKLL